MSRRSASSLLNPAKAAADWEEAKTGEPEAPTFLLYLRAARAASLSIDWYTFWRACFLMMEGLLPL